MQPELETERLLLRPLRLADAEQTQLLFPQWEIVQYLNAIVPWPYPDDGAFAYYRDRALPAMARGDEWHWTLRLKEKTGLSSAPSASPAANTTTAASGSRPNGSTKAS
jgi:ribosomal-protein-alanine N-acetyltransferase